MSLEILAGIFVLFSMAALGAPVAYAILSELSFIWVLLVRISL